MIAFRVAVACHDPGTFVIFQVENIVPDGAGCRRDDANRLFTGCHAVDEDVIDVLIFDSVQFVDKSAVNV